MGYRILGCDPGVRNFGIAVIEYDMEPFKAKILMNRMVLHTVDDLKGSNAKLQILAYEKELKKVIKEFKIESICAERFQTRGNGGPTIEYVSVMIGRMATMVKQEVLYITAAQWKNRINAQVSLDEMYSLSPSNHQLDASLIGLYGAQQINGIQPYQKINPKQWVDQVKKTNQTPVVMKQKKRK
jgi:hypothetical protein